MKKSENSCMSISVKLFYMMIKICDYDGKIKVLRHHNWSWLSKLKKQTQVKFTDIRTAQHTVGIQN